MAGELKRQPTQLDIARMAGVSTATVSRVLNGSPLVKPELRKRVEAVIAERGYFPHAAARALASNRTYTIGAVIPTLNNAIFAASVNAFERELHAADYTLLVAVSNYDLDMEAVQVRRLLERGVEGLLLIGNEHRCIKCCGAPASSRSTPGHSTASSASQISVSPTATRPSRSSIICSRSAIAASA
jgi:transcriptional regulator with XRE-family HTH domain